MNSLDLILIIGIFIGVSATLIAVIIVLLMAFWILRRKEQKDASKLD